MKIEIHPQSGRSLGRGRHFIKQVVVNNFHAASLLNFPKTYVAKNFGASTGKMNANFVKSHILRKKVIVLAMGLESLDRYL